MGVPILTHLYHRAEVQLQARDFETDTRAVLRRIEDAGYAVSLHDMREYVELHAVHLWGDGPARVARCEGSGGAEVYQAAVALAGMVGPSTSE